MCEPTKRPVVASVIQAVLAVVVFMLVLSHSLIDKEAQSGPLLHCLVTGVAAFLPSPFGAQYERLLRDVALKQQNSG
jgi:hypothetical protein